MKDKTAGLEFEGLENEGKVTGLEIAGLENEGQISRAGNCRTGK